MSIVDKGGTGKLSWGLCEAKGRKLSEMILQPAQ